jgi:hypothetical protein
MAGVIILGLIVLGGPLVPWDRVRRLALTLVARVRPRRDTGPAVRPIEEIAYDARRLARQFHHQPRGQSFAKYEAHRRAYDAVLAEACRAVGAAELLGVIAPGPELDTERRRVEWVLECAGLELGLPLM